MSSSWVTQVSGTPPLLMAAVDVGHASHALLERSGRFALNVVGTGARHLEDYFYSKAAQRPDNLATFACDESPAGLPYLRDALASLECRVVSRHAAGDHSLFVAEITDVVVRGADRPLTSLDLEYVYVGTVITVTPTARSRGCSRGTCARGRRGASPGGVGGMAGRVARSTNARVAGECPCRTASQPGGAPHRPRPQVPRLQLALMRAVRGGRTIRAGGSNCGCSRGTCARGRRGASPGGVVEWRVASRVDNARVGECRAAPHPNPAVLRTARGHRCRGYSLRRPVPPPTAPAAVSDDGFLVEVDDATIRRERATARELRASPWWKRRCAPGVCHYCGAPVGAKALTMDHLVPIVRGGRSTKGNVVPACKPCNTAKRHKLGFEFQP